MLAATLGLLIQIGSLWAGIGVRNNWRTFWGIDNFLKLLGQCLLVIGELLTRAARNAATRGAQNLVSL